MSVMQGDLARTINHESDESWPFAVELVCYWGDNKRGRRKSITITKDMYYGTGGYNAPLTGDAVIRMIEKLRKAAR